MVDYTVTIDTAQSDDSVAKGNSFNVVATIENIDGDNGANDVTVSLDFQDDGTVEDSEIITGGLDAGATQKVTLSHTVDTFSEAENDTTVSVTAEASDGNNGSDSYTIQVDLTNIINAINELNQQASQLADDVTSNINELLNNGFHNLNYDELGGEGEAVYRKLEQIKSITSMVDSKAQKVLQYFKVRKDNVEQNLGNQPDEMARKTNSSSRRDNLG